MHIAPFCGSSRMASSSLSTLTASPCWPSFTSIATRIPGSKGAEGRAEERPKLHLRLVDGIENGNVRTIRPVWHCVALLPNLAFTSAFKSRQFVRKVATCDDVTGLFQRLLICWLVVDSTRAHQLQVVDSERLKSSSRCATTNDDRSPFVLNQRGPHEDHGLGRQRRRRWRLRLNGDYRARAEQADRRCIRAPRLAEVE